MSVVPKEKIYIFVHYFVTFQRKNQTKNHLLMVRDSQNEPIMKMLLMAATCEVNISNKRTSLTIFL